MRIRIGFIITIPVGTYQWKVGTVSLSTHLSFSPGNLSKNLGGEDDYSTNLMSCGDCDFETHYESELFTHLKVHMGKEDEVRLRSFQF